MEEKVIFKNNSCAYKSILLRTNQTIKTFDAESFMKITSVLLASFKKYFHVACEKKEYSRSPQTQILPLMNKQNKKKQQNWKTSKTIACPKRRPHIAIAKTNNISNRKQFHAHPLELPLNVE
ncbi:CLUMA_CG020313, isoform A [Clunio marinus]|uniref:CLUMA_CG020313, isoform A n=1 Tax=Clunio marinus TaxID=568069 RepID=A0A1J1J787_9DIPT|nr:CLUMA_CG020313, isoform A [Clunio marinus]